MDGNGRGYKSRFRETRGKKRLPRCRINLSVLVPHLRGCGTRAFGAQTVLAAYHLLAQAPQ